jgi:pyridoxal phosphate enzyme (YggS family)
MESVGTEPPTRDQIAERHARLMSRLRDIAAASGHDPDRLRIVAVTKGHDLAIVRRAVEAGLTRMGENRVQEAEPKIQAAPGLEWHLIGQLQSNKERRAVRAFAAIHSIASAEQLERVSRKAAEEAHRPSLLIQANLSGEATKAGVSVEEALAPAMIAAVRQARPVGLMTIAPMGAAAEEAREVFRRLRELRDELEGTTGVALPELSMGMTSDAEAAAAEGATLVRIGTAIFGPRA